MLSLLDGVSIQTAKDLYSQIIRENPETIMRTWNTMLAADQAAMTAAMLGLW